MKTNPKPSYLQKNAPLTMKKKAVAKPSHHPQPLLIKEGSLFKLPLFDKEGVGGW